MPTSALTLEQVLRIAREAYEAHRLDEAAYASTDADFYDDTSPSTVFTTFAEMLRDEIFERLHQAGVDQGVPGMSPRCCHQNMQAWRKKGRPMEDRVCG